MVKQQQQVKKGKGGAVPTVALFLILQFVSTLGECILTNKGTTVYPVVE